MNNYEHMILLGCYTRNEFKRKTIKRKEAKQ